MSIPIIESAICHKCNKVCLDDCIFCDLCHTWVHAKCYKITKRQLTLFSNNDQHYYCPCCISKVIPFSHVANFHIDQFNSSFDHNYHINQNCTEYLNPIQHHCDKLECKLGKHFLHKSNLQSLNDINIVTDK